ncbi:class I SAM-dependent methyltransferase [Vibrio sp. M60_M70]|uniref:class I SAM-dependent methyltransferase n=1 Tax=Vibrio sp. M60_M70 TaxID=3035166 RepID=UPI00301E24FC
MNSVDNLSAITSEKAPNTETAQTCTAVFKHYDTHSKSVDEQMLHVFIEIPSNKEIINTTTFWGLKPADIASVATLFSAVFVAIKFFSDRKEARITSDITKLEEQLRTLYGPLKELREESKQLYKMFAVSLKAEYESQNGIRFRTMTYLRTNPPTSLPKYDQKILTHIIDISKKNIDFIEQNGWAIESTALSTLLGNLCAHFRVMEIAAAGKLVGAPDKLKDIVFPLETDGALDNEIKRIEARIHNLRNPTGYFSKTMSKLNKILSHSSTIDFYNKNSDQYYMQTNHVDMSNSYRRFRKYVTEGRILDAGCGVGRDTRYFISKGYKVQSFDLSEKMCEITNKYQFAFCTEMSFLDVSFYEEFDGIWANASLLHLNNKELSEALTRLVRATKIGGYLFASFKTKDNFVKQDSRDFYFHTKEQLNQIIESKKLNIELVEEWKEFKDQDPSKESFESYIWKRTS